MGIGRTFQNIRLFGTMSALDNVRAGIHVHLKSHWWDAILRTPAMLNEEQAIDRRGDAPARAGRARDAGRTRGRATCPTATSAGSRSPVPSGRGPSCSCSTSRRPA